MTREGTGVAGMYPAFLFDCAGAVLMTASGSLTYWSVDGLETTVTSIMGAAHRNGDLNGVRAWAEQMGVG